MELPRVAPPLGLALVAAAVGEEPPEPPVAEGPDGAEKVWLLPYMVPPPEPVEPGRTPATVGEATLEGV